VSRQSTSSGRASRRAIEPTTDCVTRERLTSLAVIAAVGLGMAPGCGEGRRTDDPGINIGLAGMVEGEADLADGQAEEPTGEMAGDETAPIDLESLLAQQTANLEQAMGTPPEEVSSEPALAEGLPEPTDVSLEQLIAESENAVPVDAEPSTTTDTGEPATPDPMGLDALYTQLTESLGQELEETSEPFRAAVVMIALAAARGQDPLETIGPDTAAGRALSPEERESAGAVARMLGSLLSSDEVVGDERASLLREFSTALSQTIGLTIHKAVLATRVRGFGKYESFGTDAFLAGRRIKALVYVEVEGFEHGRVDTSNLGGLPVEEEWMVELGQTLELHHDAEKSILAWKRAEEIVVETSRNKQRDFYLLTEVELPQTLTVGAYLLKVIVRDRVADRRAEVFIPIKIVADPALAWTPQ
jgi:hypothetical protein